MLSLYRSERNHCAAPSQTEICFPISRQPRQRICLVDRLGLGYWAAGGWLALIKRVAWELIKSLGGRAPGWSGGGGVDALGASNGIANRGRRDRLGPPEKKVEAQRRKLHPQPTSVQAAHSHRHCLSPSASPAQPSRAHHAQTVHLCWLVRRERRDWTGGGQDPP